MDQAQNMGTCNYAAQNWVSKSAGAVSVSSYDCVVEQKLTSRSANINLKLNYFGIINKYNKKK